MKNNKPIYIIAFIDTVSLPYSYRDILKIEPKLVNIRMESTNYATTNQLRIYIYNKINTRTVQTVSLIMFLRLIANDLCNVEIEND